MEVITLIISVVILIVAVIICVLTVRNGRQEDVDYSDVVSEAVEKRISAMEQNLAKVENANQEQTIKHSEQMNDMLLKLNETKFNAMNASLKEDKEQSKVMLEGTNKLLASNLETMNTKLNSTLKEDRENNKAMLEGTNKQLTSNLETMNTKLNSTLKEDRENNKAMLEGTNKLLATSLETMNKTLETRLNKMTETQDANFSRLREENNKQIDKIRETVSEKLDKTLNEQFDKSFKGVITQMTELQKSMGELKGISNQVGSLEKTLNGVKTRGIMGEVQLKQIIADVLAPQHYEVEINTIPDSKDHVEIAIKLPSRDGEGFFYLPIDSKCHLDRYEDLLDAYDSGDKAAIKSARTAFSSAIISDAKDISEKYVQVPYTTPYGILFVPFEGMYSEIVNLNLLDQLNQMHITVVGPYTLMAILSTVTNYFQALAIEKKSHEIEVTLGKVKKEFATYEKAFNLVEKNLNTASRNLKTLKTTRMNAMSRALKGISEGDVGLLPEETEAVDDEVDIFDEDSDT